jgi:diaminopimelate epimerase
MCGNGTRAVAHYAFEKKIASCFMKFLTDAGEINCEVDGNIVQTQMPKIKMIKEDFKEFGLNWSMVDTGVPHLVSIVDDINHFDKKLCKKMRHKYNANVNFTSLKSENEIFVRTYERGVEDETLACGTGMVASFFVMNKLNKISNCTKVYPTSLEELFISFKDDTIYFKGSVKCIKQV